MESLTLSHRYLCNTWFELDKNERNPSQLMDHVKTRYPELSEENLSLVEQKIKVSFLRIFNSKLSSVCNNEATFRKKNSEWLSGSVVIDLVNRVSLGGRPSLESYEDSSKSTKRRKIQALADSYTEEEIKQAFYKNLRDSGKKDVVKFIEDLLNPTENVETRFSPEECLALIEDSKLSRWQYDTIRKRAEEKNVHIFIPYKCLAEARQKCYPVPSSLSINEKEARIDLQELLNHTSRRLLEIPTILTQLSAYGDEVSLFMNTKWGCDGASDQSQYKQVLSDGTVADSSIFMFAMVPLMLRVNVGNDLKSIWRNPQCGSTRYCRVISFEYAKENSDKTEAEVGDIQGIIDALTPTIVKIGNKTIRITHQMHLTMLDGKVRQALTRTPSAASCPICKATPSQMNDLIQVSKRKEIAENFKYGLSSLHAWIRFMECILHIAYRLEFCKGRATTPEWQGMKNEAKKRIQKEFKERTGLLLDYPKQGSGNSNDGNTARRFFRDPKLASEITGVNKELIEKFGIILQTLASGARINSSKFNVYARGTAELFVSLYDWYHMPSSVHMILMHGARIIENFTLLPIGLLTEESQESRNKDVKHYRKFNTRKCSRIFTNTDLIHKLLISSDPYISSLRMKMKNTKFELDKAAKEMLIPEED